MTEALLSAEILHTLDRLTLATRRGMLGQLAGERRSPRRGSSVEFADFRPYSAGDDVRQIDWNLYARLERFFLKLFVAEEELTVHLLLDSSSSMHTGEPSKFLYAQRLLAAFGYIALAGGDRVSLTAVADHAQTLPPFRGKHAAPALFHALQRQHSVGQVTLAPAVQRLVHAVRHGGPVIFCSDLLAEDWQDSLRALVSRPYDVLVLHLLAPQELNPTLTGDIQLRDVESGHTIDVSIDGTVLASYHERLNSWLADVSAFCRKRGIAYQFVDSATSLEGLLLERLRQSGVLR